MLSLHATFCCAALEGEAGQSGGLATGSVPAEPELPLDLLTEFSRPEEPDSNDGVVASDLQLLRNREVVPLPEVRRYH